MPSNRIVGTLVGALALAAAQWPLAAGGAQMTAAPAAPAVDGPALKASPAKEAPSAETSATVAALTRLEGENVVLKAELKKLETQTQIAQRTAELTRLNGVNGPDDVRVRAVEGIGRNLYATLWSRNNGELEVKAGDVLPNGMKVVSIKANAVYVQPKGGAQVQLPMFVSWGESSSQAGPQGIGMAGVPPLPNTPLPRN